ncbi:hypothetical protein [Kribbella qitaiheensis]|uniref:hypothetical protein n=1 Tax=Kribbella qitaiheensis TaxID=1544730 RepID=UPI001FE7B1CD|nr:hypothetical protein [Kribbella qitaiheensis]
MTRVAALLVLDRDVQRDARPGRRDLEVVAVLLVDADLGGVLADRQVRRILVLVVVVGVRRPAGLQAPDRAERERVRTTLRRVRRGVRRVRAGPGPFPVQAEGLVAVEHLLAGRIGQRDVQELAESRPVGDGSLRQRDRVTVDDLLADDRVAVGLPGGADLDRPRAGDQMRPEVQYHAVVRDPVQRHIIASGNQFQCRIRRGGGLVRTGHRGTGGTGGCCHQSRGAGEGDRGTAELP